ncbi:site-specific integrase [Pseudomonas arcuscaelestis]|uniref:site-specific integrase n=1 Tax=Pseudomonas arcuscaelestis TaxID=2710591 RepID=UPI00193E0BCE|nr:site-specific integrase [Pseudomonas arcuscaelestis]MBM3110763.1 tyrosine-type recombinase/integrase [Pseudomonas arcuscaelestis]
MSIEAAALELKEASAPCPLTLFGFADDVRSIINVSRRSLYADNVWDFTEEYPYLPLKSSVITFSNIKFEDGTRLSCAANQNYLVAVKEYVYSLVVNPPYTRPTISSISTSMRKGLKHLLLYMGRFKIERFSELTEVDMRSVIQSIAEKPNGSGGVLTDRTLRTRTLGLSWLYEQSKSKKISDGLAVWPYGECESPSEWSKSNAVRVVDRKVFTTPDMPDSVAIQLIQKAMEDIKLSGVVEEVKRAQASRKTIGRKMIISTSYGKVLCDTRKFSWHQYGLASHWDFYALERRVQVSGYILIALLTGMRFHEIVNIQREGSWVKKVISVESFKRAFCFVVSTTTKLEAAPLRTQWQTVPFIEEVLDALKQCSRHHSNNSSPWLFNSREGGSRLSSSSLHCRLNEFIKLHNISFNGRLWPLATHQLRKKHARIMIRQGLGLLWLKDQLKHWDVEMTKGYGDLSLYTELQQEKFVLSSEKYAELVSNQLPVIGGGAEDIEQIRKVFSGMIASEKEDFLNDLPRKALIEQTDDGLCMYRPSKAMCGGDRSNCRPADCNNSMIPAVSLKRTLKWRLSENARLRRFFIGDSHKVVHLDSRISELNKLLHQLENAGGT